MSAQSVIIVQCEEAFHNEIVTDRRTELQTGTLESAFTKELPYEPLFLKCDSDSLFEQTEMIYE